MDSEDKKLIILICILMLGLSFFIGLFWGGIII